MKKQKTVLSFNNLTIESFVTKMQPNTTGVLLAGRKKVLTYEDGPETFNDSCL